MVRKFNSFFIKNIIIGIAIISLSLFNLTLSISFEAKLFLYSWIGNMILFWGITIFKKIKKTHINPYTFFFLTYFLFLYGHIFLYSLGIEYERFNLIYLYVDREIILYSLYFTIGTVFFLLGSIYAVKKDIYIDNYISIVDNENKQLLEDIVKKLSIILFLVSAPIYLKDLINTLSVSISMGYREVYVISDAAHESFFINVVKSLGLFYIPSLLMLLTVYKRKKIAKIIVLILLLFSSIVLFIIGTRSGAIAILISLLYLWDSEISKINKKKKVLLLVIALLVIILQPVIQSFRAVSEKNLDEFINMFKVMKNDNLFVNMIGELGGSMHPWLLVRKLIPDVYGFRLGESYLASFLTVFPSFLLGGFSFAKLANLNAWLMNAADMSYGPGFSILAEAYYNFGWFGLPFLSFIGWLYMKLISNNMWGESIWQYKNMFSAIALFLFITSARSSLYLTIRKELLIIVLPIIFIKLVYNQKVNNKYL